MTSFYLCFKKIPVADRDGGVEVGMAGVSTRLMREYWQRILRSARLVIREVWGRVG